MDFLKDFEPSESSFLSIAEKLMTGYTIETHGKRYRLMEIEFYWHGKGHEDKSTYHRRYVHPESGQWFFHYSGVDIALKNEQGYGGILIRAVADETNMNKLIRGPMVVAMTLFSGYAVADKISTRIVESGIHWPYTIVATPRRGLGKNARDSGFDKKLYRFVLRPTLLSGSGQGSRLNE